MIAIYTDIGRGHPNYLDSVLRYMREHHPEAERQIERISVFDISHGMSLQAWRLVRMLYRAGSRGGLVSAVYGRLRSRTSPQTEDSAILTVLGRNLTEYVRGRDEICIAEHPIVARILGERHRVFYLHGEIAAPAESAVPSIERMYVPLDTTARNMMAAGVNADSLVTTGLMLEPELVVESDRAVDARLERLDRYSKSPLTVGFFISGAYPRRHIGLMTAAALSCMRSGIRVRLFWGCDRRKSEALADRLRNARVSFSLDNGHGSPRDDDIVVVRADSREAETVRSLEYLPKLDLFCAAPHERINWAVGAGLPMIAVAPPIGTFAPENLRFLLESGCGIKMSAETDFASLGDRVLAMRRDGDLDRMCAAGRSIKDVCGAQAAAEDILAHGDR